MLSMISSSSSFASPGLHRQTLPAGLSRAPSTQGISWERCRPGASWRPVVNSTPSLSAWVRCRGLAVASANVHTGRCCSAACLPRLPWALAARVASSSMQPTPPPLGITALFACGCLLFYPAAELASYPAFLAALSVIALGLAHLECAANPFVARLAEEQAPGSGAAALTMAQAFNPLGSVIGVMVGQLCVLKASRHPIVAPSLRVCVCPGRSHGRPSL